MPTENIFISGDDMVWDPDSNVASATPGHLLIADNLVPDENNRLSLRRGSSILYNAALAPTSNAGSVDSMYSTYLNAVLTRAFQIGNKVYRESGSTLQWMADLDSLKTGDVAFADDSYQLFFARDKVKKKFSRFTSDGPNGALNDWGVKVPTYKPTLTAAAFDATPVAGFQLGETGTISYPEGTAGFVSGFDGTANGATSLTPVKKSGRASYSRIYTTTQNFSTLNSQPSSDTDLFDLYCWLEEPRKVDKITIMFGLNDSSAGKDPFITDYYYFEFKVKDQITVDVKDAGSTGASAYKKAVDKIQSVVDPLDVTNIKTPKQVGEVLRRLGRFTGPRSRERVDAQQASPAWTHLSVTRGQFNRVGGTPGKDWSTVTAFKVVYTALPGSDDRIYLDAANWYGGGDRALTGTYRCVYRFIRDNGTYIEKSPPSPISDPITVTQGQITVTLSAQAVNEAAGDTQINQIWIYLYGGFLDTFYRFAITTSIGGSQNLRLDEWTPLNANKLNTAERRGAFAEIGLAVPGGDTVGDNSLAIGLRKSELDAMIDNETLEPGVVGPPDDIIAVAGPWLNRMFCLDKNGFLWPSDDTSPSNYSVWWALDLRRYGTPLWMVKTNGGIVCGFTKDVIRIAGTGVMSDDKASVDFSPEPLGVGQPPCDKAVYTDGNTVVYRSIDGPIVLNGASASYMPTGNTSLLWRGFTRHSIGPLNIANGRFRMAIDNGIGFILVPDTSGATTANAVYRYYPQRGEWCRTTYPWKFRSIFRGPDSTLLAGTDDGKIITFEDPTMHSDGGTAISVNMLFPIVDGASPLNRKHCFDAQVFCDTGGSSGTFDWLLDGETDPSGSFNFSTSGPQIYRVALDRTDTALAGGMEEWMKAQFRIRGTFTRFSLNHINLAYHKHPQLTVALDSGYLLPANPGDLLWMQELELDCIANENITARFYVDDVPYQEVPIVVTPKVHTVYRVQVPHGLKGRRPHVIFVSTAGNGVVPIGFEAYSIRLRQRSSGNQTEAEYIPLYPVGQQD